MTDLEMTRLCAKAMGFLLGIPKTGLAQGRVYVESGGELRIPIGEYDHGGLDWMPYDPLHDDAQAMALVKKFYLSIGTSAHYKSWIIYGSDFIESENSDLNRAIVTAVAKMQSSKL